MAAGDTRGAAAPDPGQGRELTRYWLADPAAVTAAASAEYLVKLNLRRIARDPGAPSAVSWLALPGVPTPAHWKQS